MRPRSGVSIAIALAALASFVASPAQATLVGLWQFEGDFTDTTDFGNDGTNVNGVTFAASQAGYGQAASFSGSDTHVLVPHDTSLDMTSAVTIAAWVNAAGSSWEGVIAKNPSSNGSGLNQAGNYELRLQANNENMNFLYQRGGVNDTALVNSGTPVPTGSWQHVAVTTDGTTTQFYLNGVLTNNLAMPAGFGATNTNPLYIGSRADLFTDFNGLMDDVAIFNEVLDVTQINQVKDGDFNTFLYDPTPTGSVDVPNFSFELPDLAPNGVGGPIADWTLSGSGGVFYPNGNGGLGDPLPAPADGQQYAFLEAPNNSFVTSITSDVLGLLQEGTYDLTVALGHRNTSIRLPDNYRIELLGDGVVLDTFELLNARDIIAPSSFQDFSLSYFASSADVNKALTIRLTHWTDDGTFRQGAFDNVRLNFTAVPEPASASLALLGVAGLALSRRRKAA